MLGEHVPDAVGVDLGALLGRLHEKDGELVAAVAADDVDAARMLEEKLGHTAQCLVARPVTELVVDALEAVEIEEDQGDGVIEAPVARDLFLEPDGEEAAIVEVRHFVLERGLAELGVRRLEIAVRRPDHEPPADMRRPVKTRRACVHS